MATANAGNLQQALRHQDPRNFSDSQSVYLRILSHDPHDTHALYFLGVLALQGGQPHEGMELLRRALAERPSSPVILNALAVALESLEDLPAAEAACREALAVSPDYGEAWHNLGNVLRKLGRPVEAADAHGAAARLLPGVPVVHGALAMALLDVGRLDEAIASFRTRAQFDPSPAAESAVLFWRLHDGRVSEEEHFATHREWSERHAGRWKSEARSTKSETNLKSKEENTKRGGAPTTPVLDFGFRSFEFVSNFDIRASDLPSRPLRVGYVSPDFREHTVARFIEPILANHDPAAVTNVCYSDVARPDAVTARLKALAAEWRDTAGRSDDELAALVREDRIDVLVDLAGHTPGGRLSVFARRPAPVQATYLGYPHSTGMDAMDYRITDAISDPPGMSERYYVEQLVRLDGCAWCYQPDDDSSPVDEPPAMRNGYVTFGSFNRIAKVTPTVAALWARILDAVPGSQLMVLAPGGENNAAVRGMLESAGVPGERLRLVPSGDRAQYLDLCRQADIALDPFPYNGMTTTCDLLWLGVPTVTLAGTSHRSRVGASLLSAVGLPDLVAVTQEQYVRIAADLAADMPRLAALRLGLRERMAHSPLRDERGLTRRLEATFRAAFLAAVGQ